MRVITCNLNGVRSAVAKGFWSWLGRQRADVVCLQELRAERAQFPVELVRQRSWHVHVAESAKKGYAGVAVLSHREPDRVSSGLGWPDFDAEGRWIQADFGPLSVVSLYVPSGTSGPERQAVKMRVLDRLLERLGELRGSGRHYLVCGDFNIAHKQIDIENWRGNQKSSGFLPEERAWMDRLFGPAGWVDVFRRLNPNPREYTWWSNRGRAREKNVGWRIDYHVATPALGALGRRCSVYRAQRFSDHAPVTIDYEHPI